MQRDLNHQEVGIIGGGQLARMLAQSALELGLKPVIYAESAQCPAATCAQDVMVGTLKSKVRLKQFLKRVPVVVFENEFVDVKSLERAAQGARKNPKLLFRPSLGTIATLQDKLSQKRMLARLKIPNAPFMEIRKFSDIEVATGRLGAVVLKWSRLGYDGKGVLMLDPRKPVDLKAVQAFYESAVARKIPVYAEKMIDFKRELAMIGVAGDADFVHYPLVVSEQENGICRRVIGPASLMGAKRSQAESAARIVRKIAEATEIVGSFGVEFFESQTGAVLVNEIAPRVHNSGHYTQNAFAASQFENHWRAALGLALADPSREPFLSRKRFAMLNLLGPASVSLSETRERKLPLPVPGPEIHLHWYGKTDIRTGRKLGHLNGVAESEQALKKLLREFNRSEREWISRLKKRSAL